MHKKRSHCSLFRIRLSKATSDTTAKSASLALTTVSRNEYPRPTCSNNILNNVSGEENPRKRSIAPDSIAACCHPTGSSDRSVFQFFPEVSMRQACIRNRKNSIPYVSAYGAAGGGAGAA